MQQLADWVKEDKALTNTYDEIVVELKKLTGRAELKPSTRPTTQKRTHSPEGAIEVKRSNDDDEEVAAEPEGMGWCTLQFNSLQITTTCPPSSCSTACSTSTTRARMTTRKPCE